MDENYAAEWQLDDNTHDFGHLWPTDFDAIDFQSTLTGASHTMPGTTDDFNTIPLLDNLAMENFALESTSPFESTVPYREDVFDFTTLKDIVRQDGPSATRQHTLPRRRSKYILRRSGGRTSPISIPASNNRDSPVGSVAIQRWQNSPPEEEAASLSAIYSAMEQRPLSSNSPRGSHTPNFDPYRTYRGPSSTTSLDSAVSESSAQSINSNQSATSQSRRRRVTKTKPRGTTKAKGGGHAKDPVDRIFKCTFCCDTFKHKYDWSRHEKSLHLNMEEWVCAPHGKPLPCVP